MALADVVAAFGQGIGLGVLTLDADGRCGLVFDDRLEVEVQVSGEDLFISTVIGPMPGELGPFVLERMLATNLSTRDASTA